MELCGWILAIIFSVLWIREDWKARKPAKRHCDDDDLRDWQRSYRRAARDRDGA